MLSDKDMRDSGLVESKFHTWLTSDESEIDDVDKEWISARKYFEHVQKPSGVPANKEYIEENLVTDLVFRLMGQLIGGRTTPVLKGGGAMGLPIKELFMNILEKNKFKEFVMENLANYFYVEGYTGLKLNFNPFRRSPWGMGFPEIYNLRSNTLLLDSNNKIDPYHVADMRRTHKIRMLLSEAKERFPDMKDKIVASHEKSGNETEDFVDLFETQFRRIKIKDRVETEEFFIGKNINKTVMVAPPTQKEIIVPSRFKRFSMIPVFHTPRIETKMYSFGPVWRLKDTQDQLNIISSVLLDSVKASIKMQAIITGATEDEQIAIKADLAKPDGIGFLRSPQAKVNMLYAPPLERALVELYGITHHRFDSIAGRFAPDRGEATGDMSGKAIQLLQFRGAEPEYVMKAHVETALSELGNVILECIKYKMKYPFSINVQEGKEEKQINYNQPGNELSNINLDDIDFKIEVEMNVLQNREFEMNKAILMRNSQALSLQDYLQTMYPDTWVEKLQNVMQENQAIALVEKLKETPPELQQGIMQQIDQIIQLEGQIK